MFCTVSKLEQLGVGKLINVTGNVCTVEYFDAPGKEQETCQVQMNRIVKKTLGKNTRIYFFHTKYKQWLVGRVIQDNGDGVEIRFTDKKDVFLEYEQIYVRWKVPITDPTQYLSNFITETPQYAQGRSNFLKSYIQQRGAAWGISSLLSSVIELEPHQVNVIRRVLSDASQRYLLADEVGLGKTIEAGVIIRQAVLDDPEGHQVVVLVPLNLVQQWRNELSRKFGLTDYLDDSVFVLAQDTSIKLGHYLSKANLLVIDEAHHIASGTDDNLNEIYDMVNKYSIKIERMILLSATPVIRNELGFLRMLHLLDPVVYNLSQEDVFRKKIFHRQSLAESVAMLDPQNVLFIDSLLENLLSILPDDQQLAELTNNLKSLLIGIPDEDDPEICESIRLLRAHLSETYKLHRRILRNRRKQVVGLTPERCGSKLWVVEESQLAKIESCLESWRLDSVSENQLSNNAEFRESHKEFYWKAIAGILDNLTTLKSVCEDRLNILKLKNDSGVHTFKSEKKLIEAIVSAIDTKEWLEGRLNRLNDGINKILKNSMKVVVFCSNKEIADDVHTFLRKACNDEVIRHVEVNNDEQNNDNDSAYKFITDQSVRIIVCDKLSEEGINLQGGDKTIIHFDLPIEANRIEQRIGRVDRYGMGSAVQSIVILDEGSKYQITWYNILDKGLEIFQQSISSLQYLVEAETYKLMDSAYEHGIESISDLVLKLGGAEGLVATELKLINQQDGLDELSQPSEIEIESINDVESQWKDIRRSATYWVVDTLLFEHIYEPSTYNLNSKDSPFRFKFKTPNAGVSATLIPLTDFIEDFVGVIDYDTKNSNSKTPLSYPHSAYRVTAVKYGARLLRYGDEFVEAVKTFSDRDDRGRSYAMWRQFYNGLDTTEPIMCFRFDFLVESSLNDALKVLGKSSLKENRSAKSSVARRGDALFSPSVEQVWVDEEGEELDQKFIDKYLTYDYKKEGVKDHYIDTNLKLYRLKALEKNKPDLFTNWDKRCERMRDKAYSLLINRKEFKERKLSAIQQAKVEDEVRYAQLTTRLQYLNGLEAESERAQLSFEKKINAALYSGIKSPSIKVDVAGVVFISCLPFSNIELAAEELT